MINKFLNTNFNSTYIILKFTKHAAKTIPFHLNHKSNEISTLHKLPLPIKYLAQVGISKIHTASYHDQKAWRRALKREILIGFWDRHLLSNEHLKVAGVPAPLLALVHGDSQLSRGATKFKIFIIFK